MLGRLLLIIVQLVIGWYAALEIMKSMPKFGKLEIFLIAAVFAVLIWAIGLLGAAVLKDVSQPGSSSLFLALIIAVVFAALTMFPDVLNGVASVAGNIDKRIYPLVGAVIGYAIQR